MKLPVLNSKLIFAAIFFIVLAGSTYATSSALIETLNMPKRFWLLFSTMPTTAIASWYLLKNKKIRFNLNAYAILFLPLLFITVHTTFRPSSQTINSPALCFALLLFFFSIVSTSHFKTIIILIACLQAIYACCQLAGLLPSNSIFFKATGSFDNPAGLATLLALSLPLASGGLIHSKHKSRTLFTALAIFILIVIFLTGSRAGILAAITSSGWLIAKKHRSKSMYLNRQWLKIMLTGSLLLVVSIGAYYLKKDSADGRLLIWKVTADMISKKPLFGYGPDGFKANYMLAQSKYFKEHPESSYSQVAGNVSHPFNEYLQVLVNSGILGFLFIVISLLYFIFRNYRQLKSDKLNDTTGVIIAFSIMAMFSYPLRYPAIWVILAFSLASLAQPKKTSECIKGTRLIKLFLVFPAMSIASYLTGLTYQNFQLERKWKEAAVLAMKGEQSIAFEHYEHLLPRLQNSPSFLYNYASELYLYGEYDKSLQLLKQCKPILWDYDFQLLKAEILLKNKQYNQAIDEYTTACQMCPSKFKPLYRIFQAYQQTGEKEKQTGVARQIIHKPIKVLNPEILQWKQDVKKYLEAYE